MVERRSKTLPLPGLAALTALLWLFPRIAAGDGEVETLARAVPALATYTVLHEYSHALGATLMGAEHVLRPVTLLAGWAVAGAAGSARAATGAPSPWPR